MKTNLANNIRTFRKERGLTQEQLSEVFGVSVGAVHKWETGLSTPELPIILEMADFFDLSLDVMIGFDLKDNSMKETARRLRQLKDALDPDAIIEAEKALKRFPHSFEIVRECAWIYSSFGSFLKINKKYLNRSKELYFQALRLISQNSDPNVNEAVLYGELSGVYQLLGDTKTALKMLKEHNAGGIFNISIGQMLAMQKDQEDADIYLSYALLIKLGEICNLIISKIYVFARTGQFEDARDLLEWGIQTNLAMKKDGMPIFLDKISCLYLTCMAWVELRMDHKKKAAQYLKEAIETADAFDANPDYDGKNLKFVALNQSCKMFENTGETARMSVENCVTEIQDPEFDQFWKEFQKKN
ncbi:MAG: helix-turn-helix transcriptional regulator [Clostridiales bacterium]|nr:helix-turn-helix transcriptional regulator [Clostridiales bacterium]